MARTRSIKQALEYVAKNPDEELSLDSPGILHIAAALFDIANNPNPKERGAVNRATRAQKIILDRMVGLRRPGTHPAVANEDALEFRDMTKSEIEGGDSE